MAAIGVQKNELIARRRQAGQQAAGIPRQLLNPGSEPGPLKVGRRHGPFALVQLDGGDPAPQPFHCLGQPEGGVTVGGADLQHSLRPPRLHQHRQQFAGVAGNVEHLAATGVLRAVILLAKALQLPFQLFQCHVSSLTV